MTNEVDVDAAALAQEAAQVDIPGGDAPAAVADAPAGAAGEAVQMDIAQAEAFATRAKPVVSKVLQSLTTMAAPNWQVSQQQHDDLAQSVSFALALWFPTEIPPKWAALLMVGMSVYGIAEANRDPETGHYRPRVKARTHGAPAEA